MNKAVRGDRRMNIRMIIETVNVDNEIVTTILQDKLNMKKFCAPLTLDQKFVYQQICSDYLKWLDKDPQLEN